MHARDALIVACSEYSDEVLKRLHSPAQDAASLAEVLSDPEIGGFNCRILNDRAHYEVSAAIEEFFHNRKPDDELLLYFSCHGIKDIDGKLYFAATDTKSRRLLSTGVSSNFVHQAMERCRSRCQLLILDCCFSGAFARGMVTKADATVDTFEHFQGTGRIILTASDATQYAIEAESVTGSGIRSVFTEAIIEGLKTGLADRNGDGIISVDELYDYTLDTVRQKMLTQQPMKWVLGSTGQILVARNPKAAKNVNAIPMGLLRALEPSNYMAIRKAAVGQLGSFLNGSDPLLAEAARIRLTELINDGSVTISEQASSFLRREPPVTSGPTQRTVPPKLSQESNKLSTDSWKAFAVEFTAGSNPNATSSKLTRSSSQSPHETISNRRIDKETAESFPEETPRLISEHESTRTVLRERVSETVPPVKAAKFGKSWKMVAAFGGLAATIWVIALNIKDTSQNRDVKVPANPPVERVTPDLQPKTSSQKVADGTWVDADTGLMWTTTDSMKAGLNDQTSFQPKLIRYCQNLRLGGFANWRLPKLKELAALSDRKATPKHTLSYGKVYMKGPFQLSAPNLESIDMDPSDKLYGDSYFNFNAGVAVGSNEGARYAWNAICVRNQ